MKTYIFECIGWYGVGAVLLAYTLTVSSVISNISPWFVFLNFTGAVGILLLSWYKNNIQLVVLNSVWALIALVGIYNIV